MTLKTDKMSRKDQFEHFQFQKSRLKIKMAQAMLTKKSRVRPLAIKLGKRKQGNYKGFHNQLLNTEQYASTVGLSKVVYGRKEDADSSIVVRDTEAYTEKFSAFGVSGVKNIQNLFYGLLRIMNETDMTKYTAKTKDLEEVITKCPKLLERVYAPSKEGAAPEIQTDKGFRFGKGLKIISVEDAKKGFIITMTQGDKYGMLTLVNLENEIICNGINLFLNETITFLRYVNNRFHFETDCEVLLPPIVKEIDLTTDAFF